jgi:hypothetical protein
MRDPDGNVTTLGCHLNSPHIDRSGADGTPEKRSYADGLSPILVKRWDPALNLGAGA